MSKIEWTEQTWNPIIGCSKVSAGCKNCYAEKMAVRLANIYPICESYGEVINYLTNTWLGNTYFVESQLDKPLKRKKPTMYFVCSMGDLFHESVPFEWIDMVFDVIHHSPQHIFQILTKRPNIMFEYFWRKGTEIKNRGFDSIPSDSKNMFDYYDFSDNIWLGVTAENQAMANERIPILLDIPAKVRFLSIEPILSKINLTRLKEGISLESNALNGEGYSLGETYHDVNNRKLDWVIVGGESGHNARPIHPDWLRSLRDQCKSANVPFFFKQWGEWIHESQITGNNNVSKEMNKHYYKVGKRIAGSELDGIEYTEYPKCIK